ncbi:MAG TPA: glycerophosphodiester phosphodiesterase family protein [Allosphingosinicella sp.]|nr:glycerophosphodiester phosphodiesterase family protein [Allosphingosinicella sp.]
MTVEDEGEEALPRRRRWGLWRSVLIVLALVAVPLSLINASWLAAKPAGRLVVVAAGGIVQPMAADASGDCAAARIKPPGDNIYIEDSLPSLYEATRTGADAVAVPVQRTRDGRMVLFPDKRLDCRTNGHGAIADHDLADLKRIDLGYGYTPDGGRSFPLRGHGIGAMPTVEALLREIPTMRIVFHFEGRDPADADALAAEFRRVGVPIDDDKYVFFGEGAVTARMHRLAPAAWTSTIPPGGTCIDDYQRIGWSGFVPASCRGATVAIPIEHRWRLWGWPYRFLARMNGANAHVLIYRGEKDGRFTGLDRPDQYDQVPADFHGWLWVGDFYTMGPDLRR